MLARSFRSRGAAVLATLAMAACASVASPVSQHYSPASRLLPLTPTSRVFDAERIQRTGAVTAWDAVRMLVPRYRLDAVRSAPVRPLGGSGISGAESIRLILDGHYFDMDALRTIPARDVISIHLLSGPEAAMYFGPGSAGGAIVVQTGMWLRRR